MVWGMVLEDYARVKLAFTFVYIIIIMGHIDNKKYPAEFPSETFKDARYLSATTNCVKKRATH
jgi:hypothetical protein